MDQAQVRRRLRKNLKSIFSKTIEKINESTYSLRNINCSKCVDIIKKIYDECIKQYPSKGKDYISILYSAKLVDIREKEKEDRIIENIIVNGKG